MEEIAIIIFFKTLVVMSLLGIALIFVDVLREGS